MANTWLTMKEDSGLESANRKKVKALLEDYPYFTNNDLAAKYGLKGSTISSYGSNHGVNKDRTFLREVYHPVMRELRRRHPDKSNEEIVCSLGLTKEMLYAYADEFRVKDKNPLSQTEAELRKQLRECQTELDREKRRFQIAQEYFFQTLVVIRRKLENDAALKLRDGYRKNLQEE